MRHPLDNFINTLPQVNPQRQQLRQPGNGGQSNSIFAARRERKLVLVDGRRPWP